MSLKDKEKNTGNKQGWSSRSVGADWQHRFFYMLIRLGGLRAAYLMLYPVVLYYMLFRPDQRGKSEYYLRRRFPGSTPFELWKQSYRMSLELGKALVDRAAVGILGTKALKLSMDGGEPLKDLLKEGKGLILMTAHVGSWQAGMAALGFFETPVNLLMHRDQGDIDRLYYEHGQEEGASPFRIIDPRGYLGGSLEMMGVLKAGEILSVMGDRMLGSDRSSVSVDFLGGKVLLPYSAYKIASATGAPVAVLLNRKTGPSSYVLEIGGVIRVPGDLGRKADAYRPYAQEFADVLEGYVERNPFQFFNFFDMWAENKRS